MNKIVSKSKWVSTILILIFVLFGQEVIAKETNIYTYDLKYRQASEIIPIIKPLLEEGGSINGYQNTLIIKTTPRNYKQLIKIVESIDNPPIQLIVSVRKGRSAKAETSALALGVLPVISTGHESSGSGVQKVSVLNNEWAKINIGQDVPVTEVYQSRRGTYTRQGFKNIRSGFSVKPRLTGTSVELTLSQQDQQLQRSGAIRVQSLDTKISIPLGKWVDLGSVVNQSQRSERNILYSVQGQSQQYQGIYIKVDKSQ